MGRTVSNHTKTVCNTGSSHTCFTADDPCKKPALDKYDNSAYSPGISTNATTKTTIAKKKIAVAGTHWKPSVSPGFDGVSMGQSFREAWVKVGSLDLIIEGRGAARVTDETKQNGANSEGKVKPGLLAPRKDGQTARKKKKCTLVEWGCKAKGGALLGYRGEDKSGHPNYLDVWNTDTLDFWATRHDITKTPPAKNVQCEVPVTDANTGKKEFHTIWDATAKVFPLYQETKTEHKAGQDEFTFPARMAVADWLQGSVFEKMQNGDFEGAAKTMMARSLTNNWGSDRMEDYDPSNPKTAGQFKGTGSDAGSGSMMGSPGGGGGSGKFVNPGQKLVRLPDTAHGAPLRPAYEVQDDQYRQKPEEPKKVEMKVDVTGLIFWAYWMLFPPEILVTAQACSGQRQATIRVLPSLQAKFSVSLPVGSRFKSWASKRARDKKRQEEQAQDKVKELTENKDAFEQAAQQNLADAARAEANQAAALGRLQAEGAKASSMRGDTGAARRGRARSERRSQRAYEQWKKSGEDAFNAMADYRATMAKFATAAEHLNKAVTAASNVTKGLKVAQKIADLARQPLVFKFLENFEIEVMIEYLRTEEGWGAFKWRYFTTATMGQAWNFTFKTTPLLSIDWTCYFSLLNFVAGYIPGVVSILRWFGVRVDFYFRIEFNIPVSFTITKTQNDKITGGAEVGAEAKPAIGVVAGAGIDIVDCNASMPTNLTAKFMAPETKGKIAMVAPKFSVGNHFTVTLFPGRRWSRVLMRESIKNLRYKFNTDERYKYEFGSLPC